MLTVAVLEVEGFAHLRERFAGAPMHPGPFGVPRSPYKASDDPSAGVVNKRMGGTVDGIGSGSKADRA